MAYNPDGLMYLANLCRRFKLGGRCLTLGRQDVNMTLETACTLLVQAGILRAENGQIEVPLSLRIMMQSGSHLSQKPHLRDQNCISDKALFAALGFVALDSVDASAYEGADFVYDMNLPGMGERLGASYQTVIDPGTTEHVYDFATALENVHDVLAIGGVIVQSVAFGNRIDHGFYQVSPDFLLDYYEANQYEILASLVGRIFVNPAATIQPTIDYVRGCLDDRADGGMDAGSYKVVLVGRKTERSTKGRFPTPPTLAWSARP